MARHNNGRKTSDKSVKNKTVKTVSAKPRKSKPAGKKKVEDHDCVTETPLCIPKEEVDLGYEEIMEDPQEAIKSEVIVQEETEVQTASAKPRKRKPAGKQMIADNDCVTETTVCIPKREVDLDDEEIMEYPLEAIKSEVIVNEETDDIEEEDNYSDAEFSKYEHLLKNITIVNSDGNDLLDENSRSEESSEDDDEDNPDEPDDPDDPAYYEDEGDDEEGNEELACFHCNFTCGQADELAAHLSVHKGATTSKCKVCGDVFSKSQTLAGHISQKHPDLTDKTSLKYACRYCDRKFTSAKLRSNHTIGTHSKALYECNHCTKKFARKAGLQQHVHHMKNIRPFKCKICKATFKTKVQKEFHMRRHFKVKEFKCENCGKDFIRKDQLKTHILSVHKNTCSYKCSICNISLKGHVLDHLRIHLNEKQHKCKECGKSFIQRSQLNVHMRTHSGARPYQCKYCKATFSYSSSCRAHTLTHTGEKPFKCQLCSSAFNQLPHLKKHMRCIHKSKKPYVCAPCHEFFLTKVELENHLSAKRCKPRVSTK